MKLFVVQLLWNDIVSFKFLIARKIRLHFSKRSRKSIRVVRDKECIKIYSSKTFAVRPAEHRRLYTRIEIHLLKNIIEVLTTTPPENKANHCQKISKEQKLILNILITLFTKTFFVKKNEPVGLLFITHGNGESFNIKHSVKNF